MDCIILETSKNKKYCNKKYKCPYCEKRDIRENLLTHIEEVHNDLIPEGYTPARILFNAINKKEKGICVCGCNRETQWNEDICRYERFTSDPKCKKRYIEMVNQRKINKYGDWNLAADPKFQEKMLAGRKISGTYKYSDGGVVSYVGTFERKAHEFLDHVMKFKSSHIESPGPIMQYMWNGESHYYISDIYIAPYNLIVEIKDGGDNPNNRNMADYRDKQIAKEDQIIKDGKYNYVRVTNNQFDQLIATLAELKLQLTDNIYKNGQMIVRVNEAMETIDFSKANKPVLIHYQNNITLQEGLYIAKNAIINNVFTGESIESGEDALENCNYEIYSSKLNVNNNFGKVQSEDDMFKLFTGHDLYSFDQLQLDKNLEKVNDIWSDIKESGNSVYNAIKYNKKILDEMTLIDSQLNSI